MLKTKKTVYRVPLSGQPCGFNRIAAIDPGKKRQKKTILYGPSDRNGSLFRFGDRTRGVSPARMLSRRPLPGFEPNTNL